MQNKPAAMFLTDDPESFRNWLRNHEDSRAFNSGSVVEGNKRIDHNPNTFRQILSGTAVALTERTIRDLGLIEQHQIIQAESNVALSGLMTLAYVIANEARTKRAVARAA